jgi:hypothetical protein
MRPYIDYTAEEIKIMYDKKRELFQKEKIS